MVVNNLRVIMVLCFAAAFSAGVLAGKVWERSIVKAEASPPVVVAPPVPAPVPQPTAQPPRDPAPPTPELGWLRELNLTAQQSEQMRAIWSAVTKNAPMNHGKREALRKERDEAIKALLSDEQRKQQTAVLAQYEAKNEEIGQKMHVEQEVQRKQRDEAVKALMSEEQRKLYDALKSNYDAKTEELNKEWKKSFDDAVEQTRMLLTPEQRVKYDEIRKKREETPRRRFAPDWSKDPERRPGPRQDQRPAPKQ